ncbi:MAG: CHAT domain-containing tetratricopeptide repeat protein [Cyanobacteriota bacterium]|nr:CHAT domain-containing tetratricopeptide repeat protein [Cyanobacteriota bacterium]
MKRFFLFKPLLWLTILGGSSGLLTFIPPSVRAETSPSVLTEAASDSLQEAEELYQKAGQLYQQGQVDGAINLLTKAVKIQERVLGENHPDIVTNLTGLATLYKQQGQYNKAEYYYQRMIAIQENHLGSDHPVVAESLGNLAVVYYSLGRYKEAESLFQRALAIKEKNLGAEHPEVAASLNDLAAFYTSQARYVEAEPLYKRALAIREKVLGPDHPDVANSLNGLGYLYSYQQQYQKAEQYYERAVEIVEKAFDPNHPVIAVNLLHLATVYRNQERFEEAESLFKRAVTIYENAWGTEHPTLATTLFQLAALYHDQGRYDEAETLYRRSLTIQEKVLGTQHHSVANTLNSLGRLFHFQGRFQEAESHYKRALAGLEATLGSNHPDLAFSLQGLGLLYRNQGRFEEAKTLLERSLTLKEQGLGTESPAVANILNHLAGLYHAVGRYDTAESLHKRSIEITEKTLGKNHSSIASDLNSLGSIYRYQGRYSEAEVLFKRALKIYESVLGTEHPYFGGNLHNLALLYNAQGNIPESLNFLHRSLEIEEKNINVLLATGSERQKQDSMKTLLSSTYQTISLHIQEAPNNPEAARLAMTTILRRKGRVLDVIANDIQLLRNNLTPENKQFLDELEAVKTKLARLIYKKPEDISLGSYQRKVAKLKAEAEKLEIELSRRSAEFRTVSKPVTIEAVQQFIPEDAALVEFVYYIPYNARENRTGKPRYAAYILKSSGEPQWVDLGESEAIEKAAFRRFSFSMQLKDRRDAERGNTTKMKKAGRALDELLMQPIRKKVGNTRHFILSPDDQLNLIPFAALVDENNQYLVENYQITYVTTGRDLLRLENQEYSSDQPPVMLANPNYDNEGKPQTPVLVASRGSHQVSEDIQISFGPLPGTAKEAEAIAPLLSNMTVLTESQATENAIKALNSPQILHIATHGFFLKNIQEIAPKTRGFFGNDAVEISEKKENPLLRSGLALAGFNPRESGSEDGVLTALEAANLNLRGTQLLILSACETGLGELENGEGVYGLRRAFTLAGAESQLISLWKVDDTGTKELMTQYYQRLLQNQGRSEAFRQTQLEMLKSEKYQHPYYWAAFVVVGDWRAVDF